MFVKKYMSLVMIILLVQPPLLLCVDDLDTQDTQVIGCAPQEDEVLKESGDTNQTPVLRTTTVTLPGGISINTDNSYVQLAIAVIALLGALKYFEFIGTA